MATSPLPSRGPKRGRNCYVTPAFSGVPNAKRGDKIRTGYLTPAFSGPRRGWNCYVTPAFSGVPNAKCTDKIRSVGVSTPNSRGHTKVWESISATQGAAPKCGSLYPQLKGPHHNMQVRIPNSRGHTKVWESISATQGATPKYASPYPQLKGPHQGVGKKEMTRVGQVQNFRVGSSNHILNSVGGGVLRGGGGREATDT